MDLLSLFAALLLGLAGGIFLSRGEFPGLRRILGKGPTSAPRAREAAPEEPFDAVDAARTLLAAEEELRGLYERLGFSLGLERRAQALMDEIKGSLVVEIPDFEAFREGLKAIASELEGGEGDDALARAKRARASDPLLRRVLAAPDEEAVLEALGRAPVDEVLPFVEEVPLLRGGAVVWRTPMGLDVLHKRAADPERLRRRLEELVERVQSSALRRQPKAKTELLKAVAALRRAVEEEQLYLVTPIKALEGKLADWYLAPEDSAGRQRRRQLDELLLELVTLRHEAFSSSPGGSCEASRGELRGRLTALAQGYLSIPPLHTSRLSQLLLEPLLAVESSAVPGSRGKGTEGPRLLLDTVAQEVRSGHFDGEETVRRLRSLEASGLFVHSLVFRLLRMAAP